MRTVGVARATTKIGMANLVYKNLVSNIKKLPFLGRRPAARGRCEAKAGLRSAKAKPKSSRPSC